ncbi:FxDxF family PEP-CTERM protein [Aquabacterium sp. CECT 9606]|uniref:FxDxF family PEP-CTERM protein n=1 Tax=Aquabacterium sp. CECT 9606 TaxID=2845822 RepID=UPI001E2901C4|nr:FxDxF family PEP-CTERM protein [Aquabacterium sp. CECT 9606]CAH0351749.1 hypothetical protein AQB9606_02414 [Aquabacterium sp. CECT 9606]
MKINAMLLAAGLVASSFTASADTLYAYQIDKHQTTFTSSAFHEIYDFYLDPTDFPSGQATVALAFTELKFKDIININFAESGVKIFDDLDNLIWSGTPAPTGQGPADVFSFDDLGVSTPHFSMTIDGIAIGTGPIKGSYSFEISAAPVPEPGTYGLLAAGLAVVAVSLRKRC